MTQEQTQQSIALPLVEQEQEQEKEQSIESVNTIQASQTATFIRHYEQLIKGISLTQFHSIIARGGLNIGLNNCAMMALKVARFEYPHCTFIDAYNEGMDIIFIVNQHSLNDY